MSERSDKFVTDWVFDNVHNNSLASFQDEIERLVAKLKKDAAGAGIGGAELDETFGDVQQSFQKKERRSNENGLAGRD